MVMERDWKVHERVPGANSLNLNREMRREAERDREREAQLVKENDS